MLTLPIKAAFEVSPTTTVLVIGRSENVLVETVEILRREGLTAGASNDFANVLDLFDMTGVDLVVFGGMVPPDTKELLRKQISGLNPTVTFVQGLAGIPGLIAAQVQAARMGRTGAEAGLVATYDSRTRTVDLRLDSPQYVRVVAWWATSFTPPEPRSTSRALLEATLPAGKHTVLVPEEVPPQASFVTVTAGDAVQALVVGPMPAMAFLPPPSAGDGAGLSGTSGGARLH